VPVRQSGSPDSTQRERPPSKPSERTAVPGAGAGTNGVTVTVNDALAWLRAESHALQVTLVSPTKNLSPLRGQHDTATLPSTASRAVAV